MNERELPDLGHSEEVRDGIRPGVVAAGTAALLLCISIIVLVALVAL